MTSTPAIPTPGARRTPLAARGEPMVWLTGTALAVSLLMIVALVVTVIAGGITAFWPKPIELVQLRGEPGRPEAKPFLGMPVREESYDPSETEAATIAALRQAGGLAPEAFDADGRPIRRLYQVGNKEFYGQPFRWVPLYRVASATTDPAAVVLERQAWGLWLGYPKQLIKITPAPGGGEPTREILAEGPAAWEAFGPLHREALERSEAIDDLKTDAVGAVNRRLESQRLRLREAEYELQQAGGLRPAALSLPAWVAVAAASALALVVGVLLLRSSIGLGGGGAAPGGAGRAGARRVLGAALLLGAVLGGLAVWLETPLRGPAMTPERLAEVKAAHDAKVAQLEAEYQEILTRIDAIDKVDAQYRLVIEEPESGRFAPLRPTEETEPMRVSQIVRAVATNQLGWAGRAQVYFDRWAEFLLSEPRESNTEGGVFPVIFGTVLLTLLLSVAVVPLGVVAALYLREYAKQGPVTAALRIAINNLAGVPSIVYGVFGLGFFCYSVGGFVDYGPDAESTLSPGVWWAAAVGTAALVLAAVVAGLLARPAPGQRMATREIWAARLGAACWFLAVAGAVVLVAATPYFNGFFAAKAPSPTFGAKGLLWSSLTLALLTLPVVIVATEEAIAAVPNSMREGSYGCGASKWQTIQRIVLPRAMPGIMTGMILAMARGAGEVAPLMLVGAVKLAPELPITSEFPFLHVDRPFMHLGFHIYDVGLQSPDSEAARPIVWCTTFLLILVVLFLNTTAIRIRSGLRRKFLGEAF